MSAIVGNASMARIFTDTATDGAFDGNLLTASLSGTNLGLEMPGVTITSVDLHYSAGAALWRIQDSQTLKVSRCGFGVKGSLSQPSQAVIPAYVVKPTDMLQVYPVRSAAAPSATEVLAWVYTSGGAVEPFGVTTSADDTLTAMTSLITGQTLGDYAFGKTLQRIEVQAEDGATINSLAVFDQTGGQVWTAYGGPRLPSAGATSAYTNGVYMTSLPVQKGWTLKVAATSE